MIIISRPQEGHPDLTEAEHAAWMMSQGWMVTLLPDPATAEAAVMTARVRIFALDGDPVIEWDSAVMTTGQAAELASMVRRAGECGRTYQARYPRPVPPLVPEPGGLAAAA